jgi:hypothetical protein
MIEPLLKRLPEDLNEVLESFHLVILGLSFDASLSLLGVVVHLAIQQAGSFVGEFDSIQDLESLGDVVHGVTLAGLGFLPGLFECFPHIFVGGFAVYADISQFVIGMTDRGLSATQRTGGDHLFYLFLE